MANKHIKRYSTSLATRKMQIKTTRKYHFTPTRMAIKKKKTITVEDNKCWKKCGEIGTLVYCCWECKMVKWKTMQHSLKELNRKLPADPSYHLYPKELKTGTQASTGTRMLIAVLPTIAKRWKQFKCPSMDEKINKFQYIHVNGILFRYKKERITDTCYNMNEP